MIARTARRTLSRMAKNALQARRVRIERAREEAIDVNASGEHREPLTSEEIKRVNEVWGGVALPSTAELEVFKHFNGFDARYLGHNLFLPLVARRLNNYRYTTFFENKALLDMFDSPMRLPETYLKCIDGEFYDVDMRQIRPDDVGRVFRGMEAPVIVKPATGTSGGQGVTRVEPCDDPQWSADLRLRHGDNFIVQECVNQAAQLAFFNESSANTFRVTTLYLHGRFSVCSNILRYGRPGDVTDNFGAGGFLVGVREDGSLHERGFAQGLELVHECNGVALRDIGFPFMPDLLENVREWHTGVFSLCKLIGWDVCVDEAGDFVVLEINASQPGIFFEQLATGPIFGERTGEVVEYVSGKEFRYA